MTLTDGETPRRRRRRQLHRSGRAPSPPTRCSPAWPAPAWSVPALPASASTPPTTAASSACCRGSMPLFAIGSLRRGNLFETTAMPEIREQAYDVARAVVRALHGETRRRPTDAYGLTLTTSRSAAEAYNEALGRLLRLQDGVEEGLEAAVALDPDFAQAQAALALLGHEWGATGSWRTALACGPRRRVRPAPRRPRGAASSTPSPPGCAPTRRPARPPCCGTSGCSRATPSPSASPSRPSRSAASRPARQTADAGRGAGPHLRRRLVVRRPAGLRPPGPGALERGRGPVVVRPRRRAGLGPRRPRAAHVFYETGEHTAGLAWLDEWIRTRGPEANHRSHFSWHAALHELMQGDVEAVQPPLRARARARRWSPAHARSSTAARCSGAATSPSSWTERPARARRSAARPPTAG